MAEKVWSVGDVLSSADLMVWCLPLTGVKSANQTIVSQTSFVNDADLRVSVASSAIYEFNCYVRYASPTGADLKLSMSAPSGSDCRYMGMRNNLSGVWSGNGDFGAADSFTAAGSGAGVIVAALLIGTLFTTTSSGTLILQWAQNSSNSGNTTMYQYSRLTARRVG